MTGPRIDLHVHSRVSDGTETPTALVEEAVARGLSVVAITDHDTTAGWGEALAAAPPQLRVVPGVEISAFCLESSWRISLHLLAYWPDPDHPGLTQELTRLRDSRDLRAREMIQRIAAAGYPVRWDEVADDAAGGVVGRPHVARALVRAGLVADVGAAFSREWIGGRAARFYVEKAETPVIEAIRLVRDAGGVPVFAHPRAVKRGPTVSDDTIADLAAAGLVGIEVDHPDHDEAARRQLRGLAGELGLVATGASDWHGGNKTTAMGADTTAPSAFEALAAATTRSGT